MASQQVVQERDGKSMDREKAIKLLYGGAMILGGSIAGIWSFTANRFTMSECIWIILGGMIAGLGLGCILHAMSVLIKVD